ncbi:MAG: hypothetical protein AAFY46_16595, partial [Planctomycetota bacterium]
VAGIGIAVIGIGFSVFGFARAIGSGRLAFGYGGVGALLLLSIIGGVLFLRRISRSSRRRGSCGP